jgi:hypothetical protein
LWNQWLEKGKQVLKENKWLAISVALSGLCAFFFSQFWKKKETTAPKVLKPLDHHHDGLQLGERTKHAHLCECCGKYYVHTHTIKTHDQSVLYGQDCPECKQAIADAIVRAVRDHQHGKSALRLEQAVDKAVTSVRAHLRAINEVPAVSDVVDVIEWEDEEDTQEVYTELEHSGDAKVKANKKVKVELDSSGDLRTRAKKPVKVELETSGDLKTPRKNVVKVEGEFSSVDVSQSSEQMSVEMATDPNALDISKKVVNNMYNISYFIGNEEKPAVKMMMLKGRIGLTVAHLLPYLRIANKIRIFNVTKKQGHEFAVTDLKFEIVHGADGKKKDQMLIAFPSSLHDHPSVLGAIATSDDISRFNNAKGCLIVPYDNGTLLRFGAISARDVERNYDDTLGNTYNIRKSYEYTGLETTRGECGSILVIINNTMARKIIGMHVAGKHSLGVSTPFNRKEIEGALSKFGMEYQIELDLDPLLSSSAIACDVKLPVGNFTPVGKSLYKVGTPTNTKLRPSLIQGQIAEVTSAPSALRPVMVDGEMVDPMMKGLEKAGKIPPEVNEHYVDCAINDVKRLVCQNADLNDKRVLTPMEAVTGLEGDEFICAINRRSSPGYPYSKRKGKHEGKTKWLGSDENFKLDPDLEEEMLTRIARAKEGKRTPTIFVDTLKDERRPLGKVQVGKTRVFSAGPMDFTLVFRMYFLGFAAHVMRNRIDNEISVGTNQYSYDWDRTAQKMQTKGDKVIAGDFSNFDGTLVLPILYKILEIINDFYDDGNDMIRLVLWKEIVNSVHLHGNDVYLWTHSQPSGCPITAILNSLYNSVSMRYVWMEVMPDEYKNMRSFNKHVAMVSYGDDNLINISDAVIEFFNQITIAAGYEKLGMIYTDESKSGDMVPYRRLEECNYLKRGFVFSEDEMKWLAPLDLSTILEMTNWIRGDDDPLECTLVNVETSIYELSYHGEEVYDFWKRKYFNACKSLARMPHIPLYREIREEEMRKYGAMHPLC